MLHKLGKRLIGINLFFLLFINLNFISRLPIGENQDTEEEKICRIMRGCYYDREVLMNDNSVITNNLKWEYCIENED